MQGWRLRISILLLVYVAATVLWATQPWTDTHRLVVPQSDEPGFKSRDPGFAAYECPSVFDHHAGVRGRQTLTGDPEPGQTDPAYPPKGTPCDQQGTHRVLFAVDLVAAGAGLAVLQRAMRRHRAAEAAADAAMEVAGP